MTDPTPESGRELEVDEIRRWLKEKARERYRANESRTIMLDSETWRRWKEAGIINEDGSIAIPLEGPDDG